jgi:hypothetical protein
MTEVALEAGRGEQRPNASAQDQATEIRVCEGSEGGRSSGGTGIRAERWRRRQPDSQETLAFASGERGEMR